METSAGNLKFEFFRSSTILSISSWLIRFLFFIICKSPISPVNPIPILAALRLAPRSSRIQYVLSPAFSNFRYVSIRSHSPGPSLYTSIRNLRISSAVFILKTRILPCLTYSFVIFNVVLSTSSCSMTYDGMARSCPSIAIFSTRSGQPISLNIAIREAASNIFRSVLTRQFVRFLFFGSRDTAVCPAVRPPVLR